MKKLALIMAAVTGVSFAAFSQGQVNIENASADGYVVTSPFADTSATVTGSYAIASSFTVEVWALSGPANSDSGLTGLDAYGFLNPADLVSDGFSELTTPGNISGSAGAFGAVTGIVPGTTSANTVLAIVAWTGSATSFASAETTPGTYLGIMTFVQMIGGAPPAGLTGADDIYNGWNALANSPQSSANGGNEDLIMNPVVVPEPCTLALIGLGGAGFLAIRRRKA